MNWDTVTADKCFMPAINPDICANCRDKDYCYRQLDLFNSRDYYDSPVGINNQ